MINTTVSKTLSNRGVRLSIVNSLAVLKNLVQICSTNLQIESYFISFQEKWKKVVNFSALYSKTDILKNYLIKLKLFL